MSLPLGHRCVSELGASAAPGADMEFWRVLVKCHKTTLLTMMMFKWGIFCSESSGKCVSSPCQNGATCVDTADDYACVCPRQPLLYTGKDCEQLYDACVFASCPICTSTPGTETHTCVCPQGGTGPECRAPVDGCDSQPCLNNALCVNAEHGYRCYCTPGFQGQHCQMDVNECASKPCGNNGTCVNRKDHYLCDCLPGYTGVNCEVEMDECVSEPCQNGATCHDHLGLYVCECVHGYEGLDCEVDVDECASEPCHNGAVCVDQVDSYTCDCDQTGFTGAQCEDDIAECASDPCLHNATCVEGVKQYTCQCWPGYDGERCEVDVDECVTQPCANGGTCVQRSDPRLYGPHWEFSYTHAAGFLCYCLTGFTGQSCSVNINECESSPCHNSGTCVDQVDGYTCVCQLGFTGTHCDVDVDECESEPCHNGARCVDGVSSYTCHCAESEHWGGAHCDVPLLGCVSHTCENGATCRAWLSEHGAHAHTCHCPPGFHGDRCATPTTFSITKPGFVLVELQHGNKTQDDTQADTGTHVWSVRLRFRTTLLDTLLFYRSDGDAFLTLELIGGALVARAGCGDVLLHTRSSHTLSDGGWQEAQVSLGQELVLVLMGSSCVSEECVMRDGAPKHLTFNTSLSFNRMYVGGVAHEYPFAAVSPPHTGSWNSFLGCMEDVLIDSEPLLPQILAGDVQLGCHRTEQCQADSCSAHGRCVDLWTSFTCRCHRPYHGENCSAESPSWTFSHEDSVSFVTFGIRETHGSNFSLSLFLRSVKPDGLVLQLRRTSEAYLTVYLRSGLVHATVGSVGPVSAPLPVTDGNKHLLTVAAQDGLLRLGLPGPARQVRVPTGVRVLAGDEAVVGALPGGEGEQWGGSFKGCIQDVRIGNIKLDVEAWKSTLSSPDVYPPTAVSHVQPGCLSDNTCKATPCRNGGSCTVTWNNFTCSCRVNFTGRWCETRLWCSSHPCVYGGQCAHLPDGYECMTAATFEAGGLRFHAMGSLLAPVTSVHVELRTRAGTGLLLRAGRSRDGDHGDGDHGDGDHGILLSLLNSSVLVQIRSGDGRDTLSFTSQHAVADGKWHRLHLSMVDMQQSASRWQLTVDRESSGISNTTTDSLQFINDTTVWLGEQYRGCLREVRVGGVYLPLVDDSSPPQHSQFHRVGGVEPLLGCQGNPVCESQPCMNGGSCLDHFGIFSCACAPGWTGSHCQRDLDECNSRPCHRGTCHNLPGGFRCHCPVGYSGVTCEREEDGCVEQPCGNGGSCVYQLSRYQCVCPTGFTGLHCETSTQREELTQSFSWLLVSIPLAGLSVLLLALSLALLSARRRRRAEGAYSPSQQEAAGARVELERVLKLPPEERLI